MKTFNLISTFALAQSLVSALPATLSIPPEAASALGAPQATVTPTVITTGGDTYLRFEEPAIKFPGLGSAISGHSYLKLYEDGYYDTYGILRNDGTGEEYNVAFWWEVKDMKGRTYWFGSEDKCGPYNPLENRGDICEWSQNHKYSADLKKHWKGIKSKHTALAYPVEY